MIPDSRRRPAAFDRITEVPHVHQSRRLAAALSAHARGRPLRRPFHPHAREAPHLRHRARAIRSSAVASSIASRTCRPGSIAAPRRPPPTPASAPCCRRSATAPTFRPTPARRAAERRLACPCAIAPAHEREQLELFRALPGDLAPRDAQDLMAYPFFSLAKTHRTTPIDFRMNEIAIRVEAVPEHGMATIWDADVLIWAASQIVEARDAGLRTSRLMAATPLRDSHLHRPRHERARLSPPEGGARSAAIHHRGDLAAPDDRAAHAPLLLDQRMDRARRRARQRRRHRSHHAGLVLPRGPRRRARAHHRPLPISG